MSDAVSWKHIGLHGHSVGSFTADSNGIRWKSAMNTDDDDVILAKTIPAKNILSAQWTVFAKSGHVRVQQQSNNKTSKDNDLRFDGFPPSDFDKLKKALETFYNIEVTKLAISSTGVSYGLTDIEKRHLVFKECILEDADEEGQEFEPRDGDELMSLNLAEVSQCVTQGNTRNEIELQFHESDTIEAGTDQLTGIRFYIPPDLDADPTDKEAATAAENLQQSIMKIANIRNTAGNAIVEFDENIGTFLTPRGRYNITLYDSYLRMHGSRYDYKIKYDDISRLFLLPKPDEVHKAFVIALDKPIRQGQQRYQMLVLQTNMEMKEVNINLDEETLKNEYNGDLQPVMQGQLCNLIAKAFKIIANKKVFVPGKFRNAYNQECVKCAVRASEGHLYPLEKSFVFIHKPPVLIRFDEVASVEFQRYAGGQGSTRNFDLCVTLEKSAGDTSTKEYTFSGIDRSDFDGLYSFLSGKKIKILNSHDDLIQKSAAPDPNRYVLGDDGGAMDDEESSEDEDFGSGDGESSSDEDISDGDDDLESGESDDSDLEDARKNATKQKASSTKKKKKVQSSAKRTRDDDASVSTTKSKKSKKDPNAPKRGMSAFMFFSNEMRPKLKEENPDLSFGDLAKLVGKTFKEITAEEKKVYEEKAAKDKKRYTEEMADYSAPENDEADSKAGGKKKGKKAKKDPNAPKRAMTAFMYYSNDMRPKLKEKNPELSFGDLARLVGKSYKEMTAEEKKVYDEKAAKDKKRYAADMEKYNSKKKAGNSDNDDSDDSDDSDDDSNEDSD